MPGTDAEVQEALHGIKAADNLRQLLHQLLANLLSCSVGSLVAHLCKRENYKCYLPLELRACLLQLHHLVGHRLAIEFLHNGLHGLCYFGFYLHIFQLSIYNMRVQIYKK